jgi:hypothetical protein
MVTATPEATGDNEVTGISEAEEVELITPDARPDPEEFFSKNAFRVIYQTNNFLLPQLRDLVTKGEVLNIRPEYQRRLRWTTPQKSRLIESLLLNVPVPPIFLYEAESARYEVMDGQQRLNAIKEYLEGDFALSGLQVLAPLNGLRYSRCPPRIKRALDRSSLSAIVLLLESDNDLLAGSTFTISDIRRFIFDRLNTGGAKLNAQEIRNAIYPGLFNRAIVEMARLPRFTQIFSIPPYTEADPSEYYENLERQRNTLYATMGDCQLVLRYFALNDPENIRGSMKSMLDRAMESRMEFSEEQADEVTQEFTERLEAAYSIFGPEPFLLPPDEKGRQRISAALYDATLVALGRLWQYRDQLIVRRDSIKARLNAEFANEESAPVLTGQGNTAQAVRERIDLLATILHEGGNF